MALRFIELLILAFLGLAFTVFFVIVAAAALRVLFSRRGIEKPEHRALAVLMERYARGEISRDEYQQMRR